MRRVIDVSLHGSLPSPGFAVAGVRDTMARQTTDSVSMKRAATPLGAGDLAEFLASPRAAGPSDSRFPSMARSPDAFGAPVTSDPAAIPLRATAAGSR